MPFFMCFLFLFRFLDSKKQVNEYTEYKSYCDSGNGYLTKGKGKSAYTADKNGRYNEE